MRPRLASVGSPCTSMAAVRGNSSSASAITQRLPASASRRRLPRTPRLNAAASRTETVATLYTGLSVTMAAWNRASRPTAVAARTTRAKPAGIRGSLRPVAFDVSGQAAQGGENLVIAFVVRSELKPVALRNAEGDFERIDRVKAKTVTEQWCIRQYV